MPFTCDVMITVIGNLEVFAVKSASCVFPTVLDLTGAKTDDFIPLPAFHPTFQRLYGKISSYLDGFLPLGEWDPI